MALHDFLMGRGRVGGILCILNLVTAASSVAPTTHPKSKSLSLRRDVPARRSHTTDAEAYEALFGHNVSDATEPEDSVVYACFKANSSYQLPECNCLLNNVGSFQEELMQWGNSKGREGAYCQPPPRLRPGRGT